MEPDEQEERDTFVPESMKTIMLPALKFGAFSGPCGFLVGGIAGLARSRTPVLFALASGFQWFALGTTFWAIRGAILKFQYPLNPTAKERLFASTLAGGFTGGSIGGLIRGPSNVLPGTVVFALSGLAGQSIYNRLDSQHSYSILPSTNAAHPPSESPSSFWRTLLSKRYSPMKVLSDAEYETMLRERLLRVEVEIALVDEKIRRLRQSESSKSIEGGKGSGGGNRQEEA